MPDVHALLGASSAHRWLVCPPIARLEEFVEDEGSDFAREGTEAHELAEHKLNFALGKISKTAYTRRVNKFKKEAQFYDQAMEDHVDNHVATVMEMVNSYDDPEVFLEQRVYYDRWVPEGFGTSDVVIASDNRLDIVDLKFGKGVLVDAYQNPQLMLYALGAYNEFDMIFDFDTIGMTVSQPRLDNYSHFDIDVHELLYWAENYVAPRAAQAWEGIGDWTITDDVVKFSKVRAQLRPRAEKNLSLIAKYDYKDAQLLEPDEIAEILTYTKEIAKWVKEVEEFALEQARDHGVTYPGWKLVEGRSNRIITDHEKAAEILLLSGYEEADIFKPKNLRSMTELEKAVGKKQFSEILGDLIEKPVGKPTMAPESDKRPAINSVDAALDDFADDFEEVK